MIYLSYQLLGSSLKNTHPSVTERIELRTKPEQFNCIVDFLGHAGGPDNIKCISISAHLDNPNTVLVLTCLNRLMAFQMQYLILMILLGKRCTSYHFHVKNPRVSTFKLFFIDLVSPGHQKSSYWLCSAHRSWPSIATLSQDPYHLNADKSWIMKNTVKSQI